MTACGYLQDHHGPLFYVDTAAVPQTGSSCRALSVQGAQNWVYGT